MNINEEVVDEMLADIARIDREISLMAIMQQSYSNFWGWMVAINKKVLHLKLEKEAINEMLEAEYDELDIDDILPQLT
ncbi:hypothetical protein BDE36_1804 [Arcticibacter tournemirensis]|uniref:Uncharacterized protein n=1 Tax=Arcticibacter tournemirensis TaxID=699437 RepID=A0A5M9HEH0_9SPHI|nr:hypothetical protein [Arcticibacter tournemirensis]KAA8483734.1 hypothetical protein F1649_07545 [Arcticibacter tournemirensis]TQM50069.1 hypothetical protein BDE36_1804 [Arcticibacter tournemirensis]